MSPCKCAQRAHRVIPHGTGIRCACGVASSRPEMVVEHVREAQLAYTAKHHGRRHADH